MLRGLLVVALLLLASPAWATIYYVSQSDGDDTYNGTEQTHTTGLAGPWKTIAKVNSRAFSPGDSILFARGGTWRETLRVPSSGNLGSPITFGAYGTGANPIITGASNLTGFANGGSNIWDSATVTTRPYSVVVGATKPKTMAASRTACRAPGDWYWASNMLSVYATSDPSGTVEAAQRDPVVDTNDKIHLVISGLTLRGGNGVWSTGHGVLEVGWTTVTDVVVQNSVIEQGGNTGINIHGTVAGLSIRNSIVQDNGAFGIYVNQATAGGEISGSKIARNGWAVARDNQQFDGIHGYLGNFNIFGNTVYDNALEAPTGLQGWCHGIYGLASTAVANIYQNTVYGHPNGVGIKALGSANVYQNTIYGNDYGGMQIAQNGATNVVTRIYYNLIYNNSSSLSWGIYEHAKGTGTVNVTIENNTFYHNAGTTQQEIKFEDAVTALTLKNNIFVTTDTQRTIWLAAQTGAVAIDNNCHWRADGNPNITYAGSSRTWEQWRALGFDVNGVKADPLLVSTAAPDFYLQAGSPAVDAGADVDLTRDIAGVVVPQSYAPDIGAYEKSTTERVAPRAPTGVRITRWE